MESKGYKPRRATDITITKPTPWYQRTWLTVLLLFSILLAPIGIFLMWKYQIWNNIGKIVLSCVFGLLFLVALPNQGSREEQTTYTFVDAGYVHVEDVEYEAEPESEFLEPEMVEMDEIEELRSEIEALRDELASLSMQSHENEFAEQAEELTVEQALRLATGDTLESTPAQDLMLESEPSRDDILDESARQANAFRSVYNVLKHHEKIINGDTTIAGAIGARAAHRLNLRLYSGFEHRVYFYAVHGEAAYIERFGSGENSLLAETRERIIEIYDFFDDTTTSEELNEFILAANHIMETSHWLD